MIKLLAQFHLLQRDVIFEIIRHNDVECYMKEGYGGQPIEMWPVYSFICQYKEGDKESAKIKFQEWYSNQFKKYHNISKKLGGMYKGSLYQLIEKRYHEKGLEFQGSLDKTDPYIMQKAIEERVSQRMKLLDDIQKNGYLKVADRIIAVKKDGLVYLLSGHHRAAILKALGYKELPRVFVFPNKAIYKLWCFVKEAKAWVCLKMLRNIKNG